MDCQETLLSFAWRAREQAHPWKSGTKVGCAIQTDKNTFYRGWNIEGLWMTSIHAEVCAITKMNLAIEKIKVIVIVANTESFTPCGACIDWITQFSMDGTIIVVQNKRKETKFFALKELCPHYPKQ